MKYILLIFVLALSVSCQTIKSQNKKKEFGRQVTAQSAKRTLSSIINEQIVGSITALTCKCTYYYNKRKEFTSTIEVAGTENLIIAELANKCLEAVRTSERIPPLPIDSNLNLSAHSCHKKDIPFYYNYSRDLLQ